MPVKDDLLSSRVQKSFRQLSIAATTLNEVSDQLGKAIAELDSGLKRLGLGVTTWVEFARSCSEDNFYYSYEEIGYAKIGGKWGIALRSVSGCESDSPDSVELWLFNDGPRELRLRAVEKIPELFEKLKKEVDLATKKVINKMEQANALVAAVNSIANAPIGKK